tara:strand:+ start:2107 stop:3348 length:1242 start_codon:yes stop_codon:yes gene_type:complete
VFLTPIIPLIMLLRIIFQKEELHKIREKIGVNSYKRPNGNLIWINAVSLGEARSVIPLIKEILKYDVKILFTTVTVTSAKHVKSILKNINNNSIMHQYSPIDHPLVLKFFLNHWKPDSIILVESEIWPNIIIESFKRKISILLLQGRISNKTFKRWKIFQSFSKYVFKKFSIIIAQDHKNAIKYKKLGGKNIYKEINLKNFLPAPKMNNKNEEKLIASINQNLIILFASIHENIEDEATILTHIKTKQINPDLLTIVVPRHPNKINNFLKTAKKYKLNIVFRSSKNLPNSSTDIYIADTIGELGSFYKIADICFIGGSLTNRGGHNLIEPALEKCAIIFGPDVSNHSSSAKKLLDNKAAIQINNINELVKKITSLSINKNKINELKTKAYKCIIKTPSPTKEVLKAIKPILKI